MPPAFFNSNGTVVVEYTYDAWGKVLDVAGTMAGSLGTIQPFRYRGYVYDVETEDYYLRSRYYRPKWGRFISADMLINQNLYDYCVNNPVVYFDSSGKAPLVLTDVIQDKKRYRHSWSIEGERLTAAVFAETLISIQASGKWKYDSEKVCQFRRVDCVGLYKYILLWYYTRDDFNQLLRIPSKNGKIVVANQVSQIATYASSELTDINKDYSNLEVGMGVFEYVEAKKDTESYGWQHIGYYVGETENGPHTVIHATEDGKISIDQIENTQFNKCAYLNGIEY